MNRKLATIVFTLIFVFILALPVYGAEDTVPSGTYLEVQFPYMGMQFELYRVANVNSGGTYTPTSDFAGCPVDFGSVMGNATANAAVLESYVHLWCMEPTATNTVGWGDFAYFDGVSEGMYLLISRHITVNGSTYKAQPLLLQLPVRNQTSGEPLRVVTVSPKPVTAPAYSEELISRKVIKVWDHLGYTVSTPASVTVHLICDGSVYDTQILNAANNWTYQWDDLETHRVWTVTEEPVENYTINIERTDTTFVITNTIDPDKIPPQGSTTKPGQLPQTGLLWWPVPILACCGMVLFSLGWFLNRREEDE